MAGKCPDCGAPIAVGNDVEAPPFYCVRCGRYWMTLEEIDKDWIIQQRQAQGRG